MVICPPSLVESFHRIILGEPNWVPQNPEKRYKGAALDYSHFLSRQQLKWHEETRLPKFFMHIDIAIKQTLISSSRTEKASDVALSGMNLQKINQPTIHTRLTKQVQRQMQIIYHKRQTRSVYLLYQHNHCLTIHNLTSSSVSYNCVHFYFYLVSEIFLY